MSVTPKIVSLDELLEADLEQEEAESTQLPHRSKNLSELDEDFDAIDE